jgi:hypothetical protein
MLSGVLSPTLMKMLADRVAEKADLEMRLARTTSAQPIAKIVPHPVLMEMFNAKIAALRESLDDNAIQAEACSVMDQLIESVTIYPDGARGPEVEIISKLSDLIAFAITTTPPRRAAIVVL